MGSLEGDGLGERIVSEVRIFDAIQMLARLHLRMPIDRATLLSHYVSNTTDAIAVFS